MAKIYRCILFGLMALTALGSVALARQGTEKSASLPGKEDPPVQVEIFENLAAGKELALGESQPAERYRENSFGLVRFPGKYSVNALPLDRSSPFVVRATLTRTLPAGTYEFRLRARNIAQFSVDGMALLHTKTQKANGDGHDAVPPPPIRTDPWLRPAAFPLQEQTVQVPLSQGSHTFVLIAVIGGKGLAPSPGELSVSFSRPGELPRLLGGDGSPPLTDAAWTAYAAQEEARHQADDVKRRRAISAPVAAEWERGIGR